MKNNTFTKTLLLLLINVFLIGGAAEAQPGVHTTGLQWNVYTTPTTSTSQACTFLYYADNRFTNYNGHVYRILYYDSDDLFNVLCGVYREDNGKVYMIAIQDLKQLNEGTPKLEEYLIYDWSLNVGETAYVQSGSARIGLILDEITSTTINGETRRVFNLHYENDGALTETWIEGIGSELGFQFSGTKNNPISPFHYPMKTALLCYYEYGELSWDNPAYDDCVINYYLSANDIDGEEEACVYPNPTTGKFTIKNISQDETVIEIFDASGRQCYRGVMDSQEQTIDISSLPSGIYCVILKTAESSKRMMIIKE